MRRYLIGLVENTGPTYLEFGRLLIDFKDAQGNVLLTEDPFYPHFMLKPGMSFPFSVDTFHTTAASGATPRGWATLDFRVLANPLVAPEAERFSQQMPSALLTAKSATLKEDHSYYTVTWMLENLTLTDVKDAYIYVSLLDASGNLVGAKYQHGGADAGQETNFSVGFPGLYVAGPPDRYVIQILP